MGLPEGVYRRYAAIASVLVMLWIWVAFARPYTFPRHVPWNKYANALEAAPAPDITLDTENDMFEYPVVDSETIRNICSGTQWNDSLVFVCDNADGNVAQVRNALLMCTRYAMKAGANMVLPQIINGDGEHEMGWTILDWVRQDFEFMFDKQHFLDSIDKSCPEMTVYDSIHVVPFPDNGVRPPIVTVHADKIALREGEDWRTALYDIVRDMISPTEETKPIVIEMARPHPIYEVYSDGRQFANVFGQLLKLRSDVRILATKVVQNLGQAYNITFDDTPIPKDTFFAVHLYTKEDQLGPEDEWPKVDWENARYDSESKHYFNQATEKAHSLIYVASNNQTEIDEFKKDAQRLKMGVHSKYDLLGGIDRDTLNRLTRDQQEMVDYLVLIKCSDFAGIGHSSVSWNVALNRHLFAGDGQFSIGSHAFQDNLSRLYGKVWDPTDRRTLYHNMWP